MNSVAEQNTHAIERQKIVSSVAMTVIIVSFSMLFASLFLGYAVYRVSSDVWPPMGFERISLLAPTLSTLLIVASSFFLVIFEKKVEVGSKSKQAFLNLSVLFAVFFIGSQAFLWQQMNSVGVYLDSGIFGSILYAFTGIHAAHILLGLPLLIWIYPRFFKGPEHKYIIRVSNVGKFWHFLGIVWIFMYIGLFIF